MHCRITAIFLRYARSGVGNVGSVTKFMRVGSPVVSSHIGRPRAAPGRCSSDAILLVCSGEWTAVGLDVSRRPSVYYVVLSLYLCRFPAPVSHRTPSLCRAFSWYSIHPPATESHLRLLIIARIGNDVTSTVNGCLRRV